MTDIVSRNYVRQDIKFNDHGSVKNINDFNDEVAYWKIILYEGYNLRQSDTIGIFDASVRFSYVTLFFAAAELGLRLVVLPDKPLEDNGYSAVMEAFATKHGPIKLSILDEQCEQMTPILEMSKRYSCQIGFKRVFYDYQIKNHALFDAIKHKICPTADDVLTINATSGTTGSPIFIYSTHRQLYRMGARNSKVHNFENSNFCHTRTLHHPSVLHSSFLPGFYGCSNHYTMALPFAPSSEDTKQFIQLIMDNNIDKTILSHKSMLDGLLSTMIENNWKFKNTVELIVCGYYLSNEYINKAKLTNTKIDVVYGSSETFGPLFMKTISGNESVNNYVINNVGKLVDDFYSVALTDNGAEVSCPELFNAPVSITDKFELVNNQYHHLGRSDFYRINEASFRLLDIVNIVSKTFDKNFDVVVDMPMQKLYLAVWQKCNVNFTEINNNMLTAYQTLKFTDYAILDKSLYWQDAKPSHEQLRNYFRKKL
jgi:hypothetical protein